MDLMKKTRLINLSVWTVWPGSNNETEGRTESSHWKDAFDFTGKQILMFTHYTHIEYEWVQIFPKQKGLYKRGGGLFI